MKAKNLINQLTKLGFYMVDGEFFNEDELEGYGTCTLQNDNSLNIDYINITYDEYEILGNVEIGINGKNKLVKPSKLIDVLKLYESKKSARKALKESFSKSDIREIIIKIQDYAESNDFNIDVYRSDNCEKLYVIFGGTSAIDKIKNALIKELKTYDGVEIEKRRGYDLINTIWNLNEYNLDSIADEIIDLIDNLSEIVNLHYKIAESKKSARKSLKESTKILAKNKKGKIVGYIEPQRDGSFGYAFGSPSQREVIMFYADTLEQAKNRIAEHSYDDVIFESKKSARKSLKESRDSILDKEFYDLVEEGYIYDEDENGMNMSYGEYASISDDLWEVLADELKYYRDFPSAYDAYIEIMDNTSDDAKMFMSGSDDDFYFSIDEDEGTYTFSGEVPFILEKLFKEFRKETDLEMA